MRAFLIKCKNEQMVILSSSHSIFKAVETFLILKFGVGPDEFASMCHKVEDFNALSGIFETDHYVGSFEGCEIHQSH